MAVKIAQVIEAIEKIAPKRLAAPEDKIGLHLGNPATSVEKILTTLDVTDAVVDYAIQNGVGLIICHHPFIFNSLKNIREDLPQGRKIAKIIRANIAIYSVHTNFDACNGGINDILANKFGLTDIEVLGDERAEKLFKLVVFVPVDALDVVRDAILEAGAGNTGNYSHCTFIATGEGSFKPLSESNPSYGKIGEISIVPEYRLETIVPEILLNKVVKAMKKVHPYEEAAYDIFSTKIDGEAIGLARSGYLKQPLTLKRFAQSVKKQLGAERVSYCGNSDKIVSKVAVCGGAGSFLLNTAVMKGADVFVSSEFSNHHFVAAMEQGLALIESTHFATENVMPKAFAEYLRDYARLCGWKIDGENIITNDFTIDYLKTL
ncbi:MAG: Nif3-like dinuclear metal center hexameric protein [Negativicutes bacterium]|jgi:dinuclear metal center YbgI/SA1388 family protein